MKLLRYSGPAILLTIGVVGLILLSGLKKDPAQKALASTKSLVEVAQVQSQDRGFDITVDGEVVPYREVNLATQVGGRIAMKNPRAQAGNYVAKGEILFQIDPSDYELEVQNLRESVNKALSNIEELNVERASVVKMTDLAERSLDLQIAQVARLQALRGRDAISTTELDQAKMAELKDQNSLQTQRNQIEQIDARRNRLKQEIQQARTSLRQAELNLSRTEITSPIDGVVVQDFAEQDDFVQVGSQLVHLEDTSKVEVRFNLRMNQLQWLWGAEDEDSTAEPQANSPYQFGLPPIPVTISSEFNNSRFEWQATLARYDGAGISSGTRTVPVVAIVDDPSNVRVKGLQGRGTPPTLLRGSFVGVDIPVGNGMGLVSIPSLAYQPDGTIWVYDNGRLRVEPITVAYSDESTIVAMSAGRLKPGAFVITSPLTVASEGMELRLADGASKSSEGNDNDGPDSPASKMTSNDGPASKQAAKTAREQTEVEAR